MSEQNRPWFVAVVAIGAVEAAAMAGYGILLLISSLTDGTSGTTGSDVSPWILFASYWLFAALIAWTVRGIVRSSRRARTPYLLTQAFALVVAQTLLAGGETFEKALGAVLASAAVAAAFGVISRVDR